MKNNKSKSSVLFSIQWGALWCFIILATLVVMIWGSTRIVVFSAKTFYTQMKMVQCYTSIQNLEGIREEALSNAYSFPGGAIEYVAIAEKADEKIGEWEAIRASYVHSEDSVIAAAARKGFDFFIFCSSLLSLLLIVAGWIAFFFWKWLYTKVFVIFQLEFLILCTAVFTLFLILNSVFGRLIKFFAREQKIFKRYLEIITRDMKKELGIGKKSKRRNQIRRKSRTSDNKIRKIG